MSIRPLATDGDLHADPRGRIAIRVIWPAFLTAIAAEAIFFTIFDPFELHFFGAPLDWSRQAIYTLGFFGFWALGCASSAITVWLERSASAINRCPWPAERRPPGCPGECAVPRAGAADESDARR